MYLNILNRSNPRDFVKHHACKFLAERYGKTREFFWDNTEEKIIGDKYYYIRTDKEGKRQSIMYLFTDFKFSCNKDDLPASFDKEWIKLVFSLLKPRYTIKYIQDLDRAMSREVSKIKEERRTQIEDIYNEALVEASINRDKQMFNLIQSMGNLKNYYDGLFKEITLELAYKDKNNNL